MGESQILSVWGNMLDLFIKDLFQYLFHSLQSGDEETPGAVVWLE